MTFTRRWPARSSSKDGRGRRKSLCSSDAILSGWTWLRSGIRGWGRVGVQLRGETPGQRPPASHHCDGCRDALLRSETLGQGPQPSWAVMIIGMLRLRSEVRFALLTASLSTTERLGRLQGFCIGSVGRAFLITDLSPALNRPALSTESTENSW
jgi:hypothetical protein